MQAVTDGRVCTPSQAFDAENRSLGTFPDMASAAQHHLIDGFRSTPPESFVHLPDRASVQLPARTIGKTPVSTDIALLVVTPQTWRYCEA